MTTAKQALDYLDDMIGVRAQEIPGGRSPVVFLSRHKITIRRALRILDALESGELVKNSARPTAMEAGWNLCLLHLKKIGDGDDQ